MSSPTPPGPSFRRSVERRSVPVLLWFRSRPKVLLPALVVVLLLGGLSAPIPWAVGLLVLLGLLLAWLSYLSWPALDRGARTVRGAVLALVAVAIAQRVLG